MYNIQNQRYQYIRNMNLLEGISRNIVCPVKMRYSLYDLGSIVHLHGKRQDFTCQNNKNRKIYASLYSCSLPIHPDICIVYLHSMNGSRLQSSTYVDTILKMGLSFCSFDFSGCGNSEGDSISFGANQKYDVAAVIEILKQRFKMKKFILWGRSMGAAAALKYCQYVIQRRESEYKKQITAVVLDSCFKSFSKLAIQIGTTHSDVPEFLVKLGYLIIKSSLEQKAQFKTEELQLQDIVYKIDLPILFLTSQEDTTVKSGHSKSLFEKSKHKKKQLAYFKGAHNEARDNQYLNLIKKYIQKQIEYSLKPSKSKVISPLNDILKNPAKMLGEDCIEFQQDASTCYCSFFSRDSQADIQITEGVPTTRRKYSETNFYRAKSNKRQFQFRSTSNITLNFK